MNKEEQTKINLQDKLDFGKTPTSQLALILEKQRTNFWKLSSFVLLILLLITFFILRYKNEESPEQRQPSSAQKEQVVVIGVIRTDGLLDQEKEKFGLTSIKYQVTDFTDFKTYKEGEITGYFLLSESDYGDLLGKCVAITGSIPNGWEKENKTDVYGRSVLNVATIKRIDYSNCQPYSNTVPLNVDTQEKLVLRGKVSHGDRPAPDIGYDYLLELTEPFVDEFSSAGSPQEVRVVDIAPTSNTLWVDLENYIGKNVEVVGYMVWGYSESRYFQVVGVEGIGVTEESEVKDLVTKFEEYIQDRNVGGLMALFTEPETQEEIASYRNLIGQDPDVGAPRLFNNVSSNFIVTNWKIARREYPDNKELITKEDDRYFVVVKETRKSWCNFDPCAGTYSFENTGLYVFEIVKEDSTLLVDKYYPQKASPNSVSTKYEGLNF